MKPVPSALLTGAKSGLVAHVFAMSTSIALHASIIGILSQPAPPPPAVSPTHHVQMVSIASLGPTDKTPGSPRPPTHKKKTKRAPVPAVTATTEGVAIQESTHEGDGEGTDDHQQEGNVGEGGGGGGESVVAPDVPPVIQQPHPLSDCPSVYPERARRFHAEGVVMMNAEILSDGSVGKIDIKKSAGFGLDEAALAGLRRCRFAPGLMDNKAVRMMISYRYEFVFEK